MATDQFNLNPDQQAAVAAILAWHKDSSEPFFVLKGYAGTGKTYLVRALVEGKKVGRVVFTAPTNKATKVLRETLASPSYKPECATIYSLLGLSLEANGEVRELTARERKASAESGEDPLDLSCYSLVIVDESSMVNELVMHFIREAADNYGVKFLFMGDPAQLPPVKELTSPIWKLPLPQFELTKIMRYDNAILQLVTRIRQVVDHPAPSVKIASDFDGDEGVWSLGAADFQRTICERAHEGGFEGGSQAKVIAWRNVTVDKYNKMVRAVRYGGDAVPWLPSDRLILTAPAADLEGNKIGNTDDEGQVIRAEPGWHPKAEDVKIWDLTVAIDGGRSIMLRALHDDGRAVYDAEVESLAAAARVDRRLWRKFWDYKDLFHGVRHAYAITAHRSQGSTYDTALVDYRDILLNRNRQEAFRCLYVACTRARKQLILS